VGLGFKVMLRFEVLRAVGLGMRPCGILGRGVGWWVCFVLG
jgi:hypothetical protein